MAHSLCVILTAQQCSKCVTHLSKYVAAFGDAIYIVRLKNPVIKESKYVK